MIRVISKTLSFYPTIFQDGMLKDKSTYEIMSPEDLGLMRKDTVGLVIGKHSGRHALKSRMQELGYELNGDEVNDLFKRFKELADRKKMIRDDDLIALVDDEMFNTEEHWKLCDLQVSVCFGDSFFFLSLPSFPIDRQCLLSF